MPHSFNKIWIHAIWSTKDRMPILKPEIEKTLFGFISTQLREARCPVRFIHGMLDHIHCLFLLNPQKSIAEVVKQIKGSSLHFINQQDLLRCKFSWQTAYVAFPVSESAFEKVYQYIKNQKAHHQIWTSQIEYDEFMKLHIGLTDEEIAVVEGSAK